MKDALDPASLIESLTTQRQEERLRAMNAERRVAELEARLKALAEMEPVAWLKEWDDDCRRIDLRPQCEHWLEMAKPKITPLIPRPEAK